jgi:6-phosphogluconolactonase/glucosamine-6-phosphate isomerase/deaminase
MTSDYTPELICGAVALYVSANETQMGQRTAAAIAAELKEQAAAGRTPVLWLMAAPSAFPFYQSITALAAADETLREVLRTTHYFQFDDYPIARGTPQFPATFRHLLETRFYGPLAEVCGELPHIHPLELRGVPGDTEIQRQYRDELLALRREGAFILQLKGTGMDGHWGFHGAETPLDQEPGMIVVPMSPQNIRQQMNDWPQLFPTAGDVPARAVTFNVPMFLLADRIIDNTPQASKEYAVLAAYGSGDVVPEIPSSALKRHPRAEAHLTAVSARALGEFYAGRKRDPASRLGPATRDRLNALWRDEHDSEAERRNRAQMNRVLARLGMI